MPKRLDITLHFLTNENFEDLIAVKNLIDYMIDEAWDEIYNTGLEPPGFDIEVKEHSYDS